MPMYQLDLHHRQQVVVNKNRKKILEEGPPVGKHVRAFVFKPEGNAFFFVSRHLLSDFLDLGNLVLREERLQISINVSFIIVRMLCFRCRLWGCGGAVGGEVGTLPAFLDF